MSEYIEIEVEETETSDTILIETNITLAHDGVEVYESAEEMEEGSPLAQALSIVYGIQRIEIAPHTLTITRTDDVEWYTIIEDVRAAIVDFFL